MILPEFNNFDDLASKVDSLLTCTENSYSLKSPSNLDLNNFVNSSRFSPHNSNGSEKMPNFHILSPKNVECTEGDVKDILPEVKTNGDPETVFPINNVNLKDSSTLEFKDKSNWQMPVTGVRIPDRAETSSNLNALLSALDDHLGDFEDDASSDSEDFCSVTSNFETIDVNIPQNFYSPRSKVANLLSHKRDYFYKCYNPSHSTPAPCLGPVVHFNPNKIRKGVG